MIKRIETGDSNTLGWSFEGKISEAEYEPVIDALKKKIQTSGHVNIYMEVPETPGLSGETVWESLKFGFTHVKDFLKSVDKVAVVTDKDWLKTYTALESQVLPGVKERGFSLEDAEKAKQWLKEA